VKRRWLWWLPAIALMVAFCLLGRWQLGRAVEKETLLARAQAVLARPQAQPLPAAFAQELAWVDAPVRWAPTTVLLDNQRRGAAVGVRVFQFAQLGDSSVLVELGWLPLAADRRLPPTPARSGEERLRGLLMPLPSPGLALGSSLQRQADGRWLALRFDSEALAVLGLSPSTRALRPDPAAPIGYQRDLDLLANTLSPEKHRAYALQWFALAAAVLAIALTLSFRRRP
jgi:cytochrome oxidase assembly protein ShyY1